MNSKTEKKGRFKSKGAEILGQNAPSSVESFLNDSNGSESNPQSRQLSIPQNLNSPNEPLKSSNSLGRLHIEVRLDIAQRLMQCVFQRKCDPQLKGRATQRAVIEEALEEYFRRHS